MDEHRNLKEAKYSRCGYYLVIPFLSFLLLACETSKESYKCGSSFTVGLVDQIVQNSIDEASRVNTTSASVGMRSLVVDTATLSKIYASIDWKIDGIVSEEYNERRKQYNCSVLMTMTWIDAKNEQKSQQEEITYTARLTTDDSVQVQVHGLTEYSVLKTGMRFFGF